MFGERLKKNGRQRRRKYADLFQIMDYVYILGQ